MLRGEIIIFICGKSIVVFHCSACMLQDFCNLMYVHSPAAVCLHRSVRTQVLIKCGFLYSWLICNIGIPRAGMPVQ